jgi:hypothetical protein
LQCHGGFADQRFFLGRRANFAAVPYHFLSRVVGQEAESSSFAITIDISLLDLGADRVWPSSKSVAWSGLEF